MGQRHAPAAPYPPGKTRYPLYRRLGGPQGRYGQVRNISPHRDSIPGPSSPLAVAIPTTLPGPQDLDINTHKYVLKQTTNNAHAFAVYKQLKSHYMLHNTANAETRVSSMG